MPVSRCYSSKEVQIPHVLSQVFPTKLTESLKGDLKTT